MINQLEIPVYLEEAVPEMYTDLSLKKAASAYELMNALIFFTCKNIKEHNFKVVKRCFKIADKLYTKGNAVVKGAIENVFVYSFTKMFHSYPTEKQKVLSILPVTLYSLYISQLYHKGC